MRKRYIDIVCYNQIETWTSRRRALEFYGEGAQESEGSEQERYLHIVADLEAGALICHDGESLEHSELKARDQYRRFPNGTSVRDLMGTVEDPV